MKAFIHTKSDSVLDCTGLGDAVLTHPTLLEGLVALFSAVPAR